LIKNEYKKPFSHKFSICTLIILIIFLVLPLASIPQNVSSNLEPENNLDSKSKNKSKKTMESYFNQSRVDKKDLLEDFKRQESLLSLPQSWTIDNQEIPDDEDLEDNFFNSFQSKINEPINMGVFQEWISDMLDSYLIQSQKEAQDNNSDSFLVLERTSNSITTQTVINDTIYENTILFQEIPKIRIKEPDFGVISDNIVPIVQKQDVKSQKLNPTETYTDYYDISAGFQITFSRYDSSSVSNSRYRGSGSSTIDVVIDVVFKFRLGISYPQFCLPGESYSLNVTLNPLDSSQIDIELTKSGSYSYSRWGVTRCEKKYSYYYFLGIKWRKWWKKPTTECYYGWTAGGSGQLSGYSTASAVFTTPMGDRPSRISFSRVSSGRLYFSSTPYYYLFGEKASMALQVSGQDFLERKTAVWGEEHSSSRTYQDYKSNLRSAMVSDNDRAIDDRTRYYNLINSISPVYGSQGEDVSSLSFTVPSNSSGSSVTILLSDFNYYLDYNPDYKVGYTSTYPWPLQTQTRTMNIDLNELLIPMSGYTLVKRRGAIPSTFSYRTTLSVPDVAPSEAFDFDVTITPITDTLNSSSNDRRYSIQLSSAGTLEDIIDLKVNGLPYGFTAVFDRNPASYEVLPPIGEQGLLLSPEELGSEAILTIYAPDHFTVGPGTIFFTLSAESRGKSLIGYSNTTVTRDIEYVVPTTHDLDFNLLTSNTSHIQVIYGQTVNIEYSGTNLGNVGDNFFVQASINGLNTDNFEWNSSHTTSRYSTVDQSFNGLIQLTYDKNNLFPAQAGIYFMEINVSSQNDPMITYSSLLTIEFHPYYNVTTSINPTDITMFANYQQEFTFSITNLGNTLDNYSIFADGWTEYLDYPVNITELLPGETWEIPITLSVPDPTIVPVQLHEFRIRAVSKGFNQIYSLNEVKVDFLEPDLTPPGLESMYNQWRLIYPISNLSLGPSWILVDKNPENYTILVNGTILTQDSWVSGQKIMVVMKDIPNYQEALFNVTIIVSDTAGNLIKDIVWVQIVSEDLSPPIITPTYFKQGQSYNSTEMPLSIPNNWNYSITLNWALIEEHLLDGQLYLNGSIISNEDYELKSDFYENVTDWNVTYLLNPGLLGIGVWNFTLHLQDMGGNNITSSIFITVVSTDNDIPFLLQPPGNTFNQGRGEILTFSASDAFPHHWEIFAGGTSRLTGWYFNNDTINVNVDDLSLIQGDNQLELRFYDISDNYLSNPWTLTLHDIDPPVILSYPHDIEIFEHNRSSYNLFWLLTDYNPYGFEIFINESLIDSGRWSLVNNTVPLSADIFFIGNYNISAIFNDTSGNFITHSFILTVTDIIKPTIVPLKPIIYEPYHSANWFEFIIEETNPDAYKLYRNSSKISEGYTEHFYKILFVDLKNLPVGFYNYTLEMIDKHGNIGIESVKVFVRDWTPPVIDGPPLLIISEDLTTYLNWTVFESSPKQYTLYRNGLELITEDLSDYNGTVNIAHEIRDLDLGYYEYILTVEDESGLTHSFTNFIEIVDITAPHIYSIGDYNTELGDVNAMLEWNIIENNPESYIVLVNGIVTYESEWTENVILFPLVGLAEGDYAIQLIVTDESANNATDTVLVSVRSTLLIDTITETQTTPSWTLVVTILNLLLLIGIITFKRKIPKLK
jgi:hypothetical protein